VNVDELPSMREELDVDVPSGVEMLDVEDAEPGDRESNTAAAAGAPPESAKHDEVSGKKRGAYTKRRKGFAVPEGYSAVALATVLKATPGRELSKLWDHVDVYQKAEGTKVSYQCICKLCGSSIKNDLLRAAVIGCMSVEARKMLCSLNLATKYRNVETFFFATQPRKKNYVV